MALDQEIDDLIAGEPAPRGGEEMVFDHLIAYLEKRKELGKKKYGTDLMTFNGRVAVNDALGEAADLAVYLMQAALERRRGAQTSFQDAWYTVQRDVYETAQDKGWWDGPREDGTLIALMHSELSEALEALRHGNPADDKIPVYDGCTAELADVVIRIMDFCGHHGMPIADAIVDKIAFNKTRPHKHGGKEF